MVKKSENLKKSQKIPFFPKKKSNWRKKNFAKKSRKINAIPLVLPIEEVSLWPELSSPDPFRFQGGSPERDEGGGGGALLGLDLL